MSAESTRPPAATTHKLERAIVLQLLREDRQASWSSQELLIELGNELPAIEGALACLRDYGLISIDDEQVSASRATRRLEELGLLAI